MKKLSEPLSTPLTVRYQPDGGILTENPPRFMWVPEPSGSDGRNPAYRLQISASGAFPEGLTENYEEIPYNFYTLDHILQPGTYYWRYGTDTGFGRVRSFVISAAAAAAETPLPGRDGRYHGADMAHPRLWMNRSQIVDFRDNLRKDPGYCGFDRFYRESVIPFEGKMLMAEPEPYPGNQKVVKLWRQNYMDCQKALLHIRSLSVAGLLLERTDLIVQAKQALLELADWDTGGPTSRDYNDECSFRVAYALAFGYDWLYEYLSEAELRHVGQVLLERIRQVADHVMNDSRIHVSLYDSHAVRSLSSVLTPCCIALLGEEEQVREWLDYTIEYFSIIYTPWGGDDGGWAEGPMYWTTAMAFLTEALGEIRNFTGIDLYARPFFRKTGDFIRYCYPPDTRRASFGDQSNLGGSPGHKTAANMRLFAGITGNKAYRDYYDAVFARAPEVEDVFYNSGWWDFSFDDMVYAQRYGGVKLIAEEAPAAVKWFQDIGWVAVNRAMEDPENHIFLLTKSSPYGSVSHSHGDQNSILLHAFGEPLLIQSGYYIGFNTSMHRDWRRQTKAHNNILVDGLGQYAGMDKIRQLEAAGKVCVVRETEQYVYIRAEAARAYQEQVPYLRSYTREIYFVDGIYVVLVDTLAGDQPLALDWKLHSLSRFELTGRQFSIAGEKAELDGDFIHCSSGIEALYQTDEFEGVNPAEIEGLSRHWHLTMKTAAAASHRIITLLVPSKKGVRQAVKVNRDESGGEVRFSFVCNERTFNLT